MNIAIRFEGGVGDHLLANRFIGAIKDKHQKSNLNFYSDTENNYKQINLLQKLWPSIYRNDNCFVIEQRKSKEHKVKSQFGEEIYNCHLDNTLDKYTELFQKADKFYNLCIDNLDWIRYDFDWKRYFYFFPQPEIEITNPININKYILTHLYPRPNSDHNLEQWYVILLIKKLLDSGKKVVSICNKEHMNFYKEIQLLNNPNFYLVDYELHDIFGLSKDCEAFIGVDSGLRYIPLHFGKPTYVFSKYCNEPFQAAPSHVLRWLIFEKYILPMHFNIETVTNIILNSTLHPASSLFPYIGDKIENYIIERYYK